MSSFLCAVLSCVGSGLAMDRYPLQVVLLKGLNSFTVSQFQKLILNRKVNACLVSTVHSTQPAYNLHVLIILIISFYFLIFVLKCPQYVFCTTFTDERKMRSDKHV
jgi:hypothetical protein